MDNLLMVFAKAPIAGLVKTRLFPHISFEEAARLQHAFLADTLDKAFSLPDTRVCLAYEPASALPFLKELFDKEDVLEYLPQEGVDLGERMRRAFDEGFRMGAGRVLIIGSDVPTLPERSISAGFERLSHSDVVLGPAVDGGYYLIGLNRPAPALFEGIVWSGPDVFASTLKRAFALGLRVDVLPEHRDVDSFTDLKLLVTELLPPNTHRFVSEMMPRLLSQSDWVE